MLQMLFLGTGMGLSTAPATEAILGVVRPEQAGIGSAVNDATRLVGGTLGVAVMGSVSASLYRHSIDHAALPAALRAQARRSYGAGHALATQQPSAQGRALLYLVNNGFLDGNAASSGVNMPAATTRSAMAEPSAGAKARNVAPEMLGTKRSVSPQGAARVE